MERVKLLLIIVIFVDYSGLVVGDEELSCCPPGALVVTEERDECWEPASNTSSRVRLDCNDTVNIYDFTVEGGSIILEQPFMKIVNSSLLCTGNTTSPRSDSPTLRPIALLCYSEEYRPLHHYYIEDAVLGYCMTASFLFLLLTVIIYSCFRELRDLFGKSVINFCSALAVGLKLVSVMKFLSYTEGGLCALRGFATYFFLLAAFFWANSISIQVLLETRRPCAVDYGWRQLKWYALYAWGVPAALTAAAAAANYLPGHHARPGIGDRFCWFQDLEQQWHYMYSVMTALIVINIGIYVYILRVVWRQTFLSTRVKALRFKVWLSLRLLVVMGLPWLFEMVSASVTTHIVWSIINIFNSSQGILMFLILVVFRRKVIRCLAQSGWLCGLVRKGGAAGDTVGDTELQTELPGADTRH